MNEFIGPRLLGEDPCRQSHIDYMMNELDETPNKAKLGANAILDSRFKGNVLFGFIGPRNGPIMDLLLSRAKDWTSISCSFRR